MKAFEQPLSEREEKEMIKKSQNGDMKARNILVEKNMRLVAHMIKKYMSADRDTDDLISVGTIGLIKAVNTFNPDKKIRLATYAAKCIDNELLMMLRNDRKKLMELSLSEPIGTDKEGNDITFMDIVGDEERDDGGARIKRHAGTACTGKGPPFKRSGQPCGDDDSGGGECAWRNRGAYVRRRNTDRAACGGLHPGSKACLYVSSL